MAMMASRGAFKRFGAAVLLIGLAAAWPCGVMSQPVTEAMLAAALGHQDATRQRLQQAERRLAQARAEAQREIEAIAQRVRAETAPLARRLEELQAAPGRAVPPVEEPGRLSELTRLLAERDAQLARLAEARDRAAAELRRAQTQVEMAATTLTRATETARAAADAEARANQARASLAAPGATRADDIRAEAQRLVPRAVLDAAARAAGDALSALSASSQRAPVEPERNGRFVLRDLPAGRWWAVGLTLDRRDVWGIWEMTVSRDGLLLLGPPVVEDLAALAPPVAARRRGGAYDACLLENLRGVASDAAAAAIISACRARHPDDARYDVTVEMRPSDRPPLLLPMTAAEMREVSATVARYFATLEPEIERAARLVVADRLRAAEANLQAATAAARAAVDAEALRRDEADGAARRVRDARAALEQATQAIDAFRAAPDGQALTAEATQLRADLETRRADAARQLETERSRLRDEVATVQAELRQTEARVRAAEEPRRLRATQAEAAAAAELEAARHAAGASDAEVPRLRRALAERWRDEYLRQRVSVSLSIVPVPYSSQGDQTLCVSISNRGDLVLLWPGLSIRFRGRTLSELDVPPGELTRAIRSLETPTVTYQNRFNETVSGLRPGTSWGGRPGHFSPQSGCTTLSVSAARTGDTGRAFERAGGFSTSLQDWSVSLSADLARMEDVRQVSAGSAFGIRRWEHVASSPETLFAQRLEAIRPTAPVAREAQPAVAAQTTPTEPSRPAHVTASTAIGVADAQRRLRDLGHYRGAVDGLMGPGTRGAIRAFERERGLPETGELSGRTAEAMLAIP